MKSYDMPDWLQQKYRDKIFGSGMIAREIPPFYHGFEECFQILKPHLEVMTKALEWNAHTICLDNTYDDEANKANVQNLLRNIREAQEALKTIKELQK